MSKKVQKESKKMQKQQALKAQAKIPFLFWDFIASFRLEIKR